MHDGDPSAFALLQEITDQFLDRDLEREEVIRVRNSVTQHLLPLMEHPHKIFILGSYSKGEKQKLSTVQATLNSLYRVKGEGDSYVYLMEDVPGSGDMWINLDIKFRLLADIADNIVGVAEHDEGGFVFEQGILATNPDYRKKTVLLKKDYGEQELEHNKFSAMQSAGLFKEFDKQDKLFRWQDWEDLVEATSNVFDHIEANR